MLHAFNQKNARRVLAASGDEHTNDKNEDAITSMVFTPLTFMTARSALDVLVTLLGAPLEQAVQGREPIRHEPRFWPGNLRASAWAQGDPSRCEPDFIIGFDFACRPPVLVIGEMKWDWRVTSRHLEEETRRQRSALSGQLPGALQVVFAVTKFRLAEPLNGVVELTWAEVQRKARQLENQEAESPAGRWGALVGTFLEKAEQVAFQGFLARAYPFPPGTRPVFWKEIHE